MNQSEFYTHPEVLAQIEIQKRNAYGSNEHKDAFLKIGELADKLGCGEEYRKAGGGIYE